MPVERDHLATAAATSSLDSVKKEFGRRVRNATIAKGWRQAELARVSGLAPQSISDYSAGKILPTMHNLEMLARALGVSGSDLMPAEKADPEMSRAEIRGDPTDPRMAWIVLNRRMTMKSAVQIMSIVEQDDPTSK